MANKFGHAAPLSPDLHLLLHEVSRNGESVGHMNSSNVVTVIRRNKRAGVRACRLRAIRVLSWNVFEAERVWNFASELALFGLLAALSAWPICSAIAALRTMM
jgi:hypothetical protein